MKATLEFTLPEDSDAHKHAVNGSKYYYVIDEVKQFIRQTLKHVELSDKEYKRLESIQDKIYEEMEDVI